MFAKVFLTINLFFITTAQVSLMCQRLVDFYEPIYHRLLTVQQNPIIMRHEDSESFGTGSRGENVDD